MQRDDERRDAGFSIFYMGINIGGFLAPLVTGFLAQSDTFKSWLAAGGFDPADSWHWGFGAAGVGMTLGLIGYFMQAQRLAHVGRAPAEATGSWGTSLLVIVGTLGIMVLTVLSDDPRFQWLRAAFLFLPVAAIVWFAMRGDIDGQRLAAVFVFFIAAMVFWAIFEQAGVTIALFGLELTRAELFGWSFPAAWYPVAQFAVRDHCWRRCSRIRVAAAGIAAAVEPGEVRPRAVLPRAVVPAHGAGGNADRRPAASAPCGWSVCSSCRRWASCCSAPSASAP